MNAPREAAAIDFVLDEAALLDAGRFEDWLALFAEDGRYWVPLQGARQAGPDAGQSIALEDRLLLQLRVKRLASPRAHSLHPAVAGQHVLQAPRVLEAGEDALVLHTPFLYVESQGERETLLAGHCRHRLRPAGSSFRIVEKRVNLLNPTRPLPAIQLFI